MSQRVRIAHLSDLHVAHVTSNLIRLVRLVRGSAIGLGLAGAAASTLLSSLRYHRAFSEPVMRAVHMLHSYRTRYLIALAQSLEPNGVDHVVLTGDTANLGAPSEFAEALSILGTAGYSGARLSLVPGNHDVLNFRDAANFLNMAGTADYPHLDQIAPGIYVLCVDSTTRMAKLDWRDALTINSRGIITPAALQRAETLLASVPPGSFVIVCCHHHLVELPADGYIDGLTGRVDPRLIDKAENAGKLLDLCEQYNAGLILFGHRHHATNNRFSIRGIPSACSGAVTQPDSEGYLHYRVFDIEDRKLAGRKWIKVDSRSVTYEQRMRYGRIGPALAVREFGSKVTVQVLGGDTAGVADRVAKAARELDAELIRKIRGKGRT